MKVSIFLPMKEFVVGGIRVSFQNLTRKLEERGIEVLVNDYMLRGDIVHIYAVLPTLIPIAKAAKLKGKPLVFHMHTTPEDTVNSFIGDRFFSSYVNTANKIFCKEADIIITPSQFTKDSAVRAGVVDPEKVVVISNGVDLEVFKYREQLDIGKRAVIGAVSTVLPRKGVDMFIKTAEKLENHIFVWYGKYFDTVFYSGSNKMRALIKNKPENVFFHGYARDITRAYNLMDIFVSFSKVENEGIPTLEAAASGVPMVLRPIPPYIEKFEGAALFADTPEKAAEAISTLIEDRELKEKMRKKARKIAEKYNLDNVADQVIKIYEKLLEK